MKIQSVFGHDEVMTTS